jgi:DNA-binding CsgD family transcriptional regulator
MAPRAQDYTRAKRAVETLLDEPAASVDGAIRSLLDAVADVVEITGSCWHHTDPATGLPISGSTVGDPAGSFEESLQYEFRHPDVNCFSELRDRRMSVASIASVTHGHVDQSARFREMVSRSGAADELRILLGDAFGTWAAVVLFTERAMTGDDLRFAADLVPIVSAALRTATAHAAARASADPTEAAAQDGPSVLILDTEDRIVAADAAARARLALVPEERDVQVPGLVSFLAAKARWDRSGTPARAQTQLGGRWFAVDASRLEAESDGGSVAVVMQPARSDSVLDGVLRALGLSAREREVAALAVQGRSTKAIASELTLSAWTVQDHLKAVYEKTGRGRSDLATLAV